MATAITATVAHRLTQNIKKMSKIKLETPFKAFRGKICSHSDIIYAKRGKTLYTTQICNPRTKPFSAEETARQNKFSLAVAATNTILADAEQRATYEAAFKKQDKYSTLRGYIIAQEYAKL